MAASLVVDLYDSSHLRLTVVPGDVGMLNLTCAPVDNENHCSVMWDALMFGSDVIPATNSTLKYNVSYYVGNISSGSKTVDVPMVTINLPGVDSDVSVTVLAFNVFGFGEESNASDVISEITPSIILPTAPPSQSPGTMTPSMIPSTAPPSQPPVGASTDDVDNSGAIIGGVIGGICGAILVIILIILIVYCCMKQEKSNRPRNTPMTKNNIPLYDTVQDPEVSDMVKIEPNPAYQGLPPDHVKMETNPAYQVITSDQVNRKADTDLSSHSGRASISKQKPVGDVNYYEDIINDQINITMTKNPSYVVPRL